MRHTLKAVFNDRCTAQNALDKLLGLGYTSADAVLVTVSGHGKSGGIAENAVTKWQLRGDTSPARLLARLLHHEKGDAVTAPTSRSSADSHVLTLVTDSASEAERATSLIPEFTDASSKESSAIAHDGRPGLARTRYRRHIPGARQFYARGPGAAAFLPGGDDETREANRFGHDIHNNDRYRNRSWSEAAADLKILWEARSSGGGDWKLSESAIRFGWDSTTPEIDDDSYYRSHWNTSYGPSPRDSNARLAHGWVAPETVPEPGAAWIARHPGELRPWDSFVDALCHGWGKIAIGMDMDETDYRIHHANNYPGTDYNDLAPVYRYGNNVRHRAVFRGRGWDEVESELRTEWKRAYGQGNSSTWDEMKAAVHRGWQHVRS